MDVVAVRSRTGEFFSTDFYVKLKVPIYGVEQASAIFLGLSEDDHPESNPSRTLSAEEIIFQTESEMGDNNGNAVDESEEVTHDDNSDHYTLLRDRLEPFLVNIYNNHHICDHPHLVAYVGERQMLRFYDPVRRQHYATPPSRMLQHLNLLVGKNSITVIHRASQVQTSFPIWVYNADARLVIMDIDGTITKSDVAGYITTVYFGIYSYVHYGLVEWLHNLQTLFNYQCLYLTARPFSHRKQTRLLLQMIRGQINPECELPEGPLFTTADTTMNAFYHEFVVRDQARSKSDLLCSIWDVFKKAGCTSLSPFKIGVGNKEHDAMAYNSVGVPGDAVFVVNKESKIVVWKYSRPSVSRNLSSRQQTPQRTAAVSEDSGHDTSDDTPLTTTQTTSTSTVTHSETDAITTHQEETTCHNNRDTDDNQPVVQEQHSKSHPVSRHVMHARSRSERLPSTTQVPSSARMGQSVKTATSRDDLHVTYHPSDTAVSSAVYDRDTVPAGPTNTIFHPDFGHINPQDNAVTLALHAATGVYAFQTYADPTLLQYICELELRRSTNEEQHP